MGYEPLTYEALLRSTHLLEQQFNRLTHRYLPPDYVILHGQVSALELSYHRRQADEGGGGFWSVKSSTRLKQMACLVKLIEILPKPSRELTDEQRNQSQNIILGALFYRWLRIHHSYQGNASYWLSLNPSNSILYVLIGEILGLDTPELLDPQTVSTCCCAYERYLRHYSKSMQLQCTGDDPQFGEKLKEIIERADAQAKPITEQLRRLETIQLMAIFISEMDANTSVGFERFTECLSNKLSSQENLARVDMIHCLGEVPSLTVDVKHLIDYLMPDEQSFHAGNRATFVSEMKARACVMSRSILLGFYIVALEQVEVHEEGLRKTLREAMGLVGDDTELTRDDRECALLALQYYLSMPGRGSQDFSGWKSLHHLQRDVDSLLKGCVVVDEHFVTVGAAAGMG